MSHVFVMKSLLTQTELNALRNECDSYLSAQTNDLSELGASLDLFEHSIISEDSVIRNSRIDFLNERWRDAFVERSIKCTLESVIFEKLSNAAQLFFRSKGIAYLFNEHYVVKSADCGVEFRWHCDSNEQLLAIPHPHRPQYLSLWCPLDDVSQNNGTIAFSEHTSIHTLDCSKLHHNSVSYDIFPDEERSMAVNDAGMPNEDEKGLELVLSPGSVVVFSSTAYHRSGVNQSGSTRRVYYAQYSEAPITAVHSSLPLCFAVPCESVAQP